MIEAQPRTALADAGARIDAHIAAGGKLDEIVGACAEAVSYTHLKGYDQKYKRSIYSMDVLYGFKTVYPELAVRALG